MVACLNNGFHIGVTSTEGNTTLTLAEKHKNFNMSVLTAVAQPVIRYVIRFRTTYESGPDQIGKKAKPVSTMSHN